MVYETKTNIIKSNLTILLEIQNKQYIACFVFNIYIYIYIEFMYMCIYINIIDIVLFTGMLHYGNYNVNNVDQNVNDQAPLFVPPMIHLRVAPGPGALQVPWPWHKGVWLHG